jgi:uncharacterized protein
MDRVFLDANVLFSAAYRPDSGLLRLWEVRSTQLVTSVYAAMEAKANLSEQDQQERLAGLLASLEFTAESGEVPLAKGIALPADDQPILRAAIASGATHLLTGDKTHFGRYYGRAVQGVHILPPGEYLRDH